MAAITFGAVVGLALNYQTLKELRSPKVEPVPPAVVEEEEEKIATYSGTIKPSAPSLYSEGTHFLEDENGEIVALLKSAKIDLSFIEGQTVEVEGRVKKTVEGEQMILDVEKVRF